MFNPSAALRLPFGYAQDRLLRLTLRCQGESKIQNSKFKIQDSTLRLRSGQATQVDIEMSG